MNDSTKNLNYYIKASKKSSNFFSNKGAFSGESKIQKPDYPYNT
jgi:hypothetical protein